MVNAYTDSTGQSTAHPLVAYGYQRIRQQQQWLTCSGLDSSGNSINRVTTYTYDMSNRVIKIVYPYNNNQGDIISDEFFQYDKPGNLVAKLQGLVNSAGNITSGAVTAYAYDTLNRLTAVGVQLTNRKSGRWL